jgi:hypothetical protein
MSKVVNISVDYIKLNIKVGFEITSDDQIKLAVVSPVKHCCSRKLTSLMDVAKHLHLEEKDHPTFISLFDSDRSEGTHFVVKAPRIECDYNHMGS